MSEPRNPAIAAALSYAPGSEAPPRMTARGTGRLAERIIAMAVENGIPIREDENLAHLLDALDVDTEIPPALYHAVAEVLVFVYRINGMMIENGDGDTEA